jgi:hypothetical protein
LLQPNYEEELKELISAAIPISRYAYLVSFGLR